MEAPRRHRAHADAQTGAAVRELRAAGLRIADIARLAGVSRTRVKAIVDSADDVGAPTKTEDDVLGQWAQTGEFDPDYVGGKALHGAAAAAAGRALLEAAGVDVDTVDDAGTRSR